MFDLLGSRRLQLLLTALVHIAASASPLSGKRLAQRLNCPRRYLESDLQALVQCGILESRRGALGGYFLAQNPQRASLLDVMRCLAGEAGAEIIHICPVQAQVVLPTLQGLHAKFEDRLAEVDLAQLIAKAEAMGLVKRRKPTPDFSI